MPYSFIGQAASAGTTNGLTSVVTSTSLTVQTGDTIIVPLYSGDASGNTISDGGSNTYIAAGNVNSNLFFYYCLSAASGTYTVTGNCPSDGHAVAALQYRGIGSFQNFTGADQNGPGNGANNVNSGNAACTAAPALVWGFAMDSTQFNNGSAVAAPTAGTSPLAFTSRGGLWLAGATNNTAISEDVRVTSTGNYAATFGSSGGSAFDTYYSAVMIFGEIVPPPPNIIGGAIFVTA